MNKGASLLLPEQDRVAEGRQQLVYQHPHAADLLVKVMRPEVRETHVSRAQAPLERLRNALAPSRQRFGAFRSWHLQHQEYLAIVERLGALPDFLPKLGGYIPTRLGPGCVVERIASRDGSLAPTLRAVQRAGHQSENLIEHIETLLDKLRHAHAMFNDLHRGNVVLGVLADGRERLVIIDGLRADTTLIPLRTMSDRIYQCWFGRNREKFRETLLGTRARRPARAPDD